jgi:hypothetical protein
VLGGTHVLQDYHYISVIAVLQYMSPPQHATPLLASHTHTTPPPAPADRGVVGAFGVGVHTCVLGLSATQLCAGMALTPNRCSCAPAPLPCTRVHARTQAPSGTRRSPRASLAWWRCPTRWTRCA